jgi:hypothetical protein
VASRKHQEKIGGCVNEVVTLVTLKQVVKSLWLRIGNCETLGRFTIVVEINGGATNGGIDEKIYDSINECEGRISQHTNLSWLLNNPASDGNDGEG